MLSKMPLGTTNSKELDLLPIILVPTSSVTKTVPFVWVDDRVELDDSPLCGPDDVAKFQSVIGACQWMISRCRFDLATAVMSLSRFHHAPRQRHVDRLKHICGYIRKFPHGALRFCTALPTHLWFYPICT